MAEWTSIAERNWEPSGASGLACSVGIMAHNEGANIANAIRTILDQQITVGQLAEVIVVASGCTDDTVPTAVALARQDPRVRLVVQERREGKASAINLFLSAARSPILLMASADVLLCDGAVDALLRHFHDPQVGMVGAHPVPVNSDGRFLGYAVHLVWALHDRIARIAPKLGEVVAFRNVVPSIALDTAVDEISIQALISQLGYRLVYEPQAIVYNRGPATVNDFLRQRRRIYAGHLRIWQQQGYAASTMSVWQVGRALWALRPIATPQELCWTIGAVGLEGMARGMGMYDYLRRRQHHVWQMAATTKSHIAEAARAQVPQSVLVFRIISFHRHELELGTRGSQILAQQVAERIRQQLGAAGTVTSEPGGTVIAVLPVEREVAERTAHDLIQQIEALPCRLSGRRDGVAVKLACGIIAFLQTGHPLALSLPAAI